MGRKNQNAQRGWKPSPEQLDRLEFGTPLMVSTSGGTVDFDLLIGGWALVFAAYSFVAHFIFVMVVGLWGVTLEAI